MCVRGMGQKYPVATPLALLNWLKESHMCKSRTQAMNGRETHFTGLVP